ncbi:hypothetical protein EDD22DRAFT_349843 [Suillus occidentalis]|nr:hypothetical protein EDD22DRAFT_349843 [Suillus occidentalis]
MSLSLMIAVSVNASHALISIQMHRVRCVFNSVVALFYTGNVIAFGRCLRVSRTCVMTISMSHAAVKHPWQWSAHPDVCHVNRNQCYVPSRLIINNVGYQTLQLPARKAFGATKRPGRDQTRVHT